MTAPPQMNGQAPILQGGTTQEDPSLGVNAALRAFRVAAENAAGEASGAEAKDWAAAALSFAQAIVVLDPQLSQGGTPLAHDAMLEQIRGETQQAVAQIQGEHAVRLEQVRGANALKQARETAAAPTPARTRVATVNRDPHGRMQSASVTES
jgi:hypothetical protein